MKRLSTPRPDRQAAKAPRRAKACAGSPESPLGVSWRSWRLGGHVTAPALPSAGSPSLPTRSVLVWIVLGLVLGLLPQSARAEDAPGIHELTPTTEAAIQRGIDFLIEKQDHSGKGSWGGDFKLASTSLAGLALVASGDSYNRGHAGHAIADAVHYLLTIAKTEVRGRPDQCFFSDGQKQQGRVHAHGFAMLFLAEVYGHTTKELDAEIKRALRGAVSVSLEAQTDAGGWGYSFRFDPEWGSGDQDEGSVTVTQVQALRAARNVGIYVPTDAIGRALGYLKRSMNTVDGACKYSLSKSFDPKEASRRSFELTAAAVSTLNASGIYIGAGGAHSNELTRGLEYLRTTMKTYKNPFFAATDFRFYGNFYAAQAMFQAEPRDWEAWYAPVYQELVNQQLDSGGWKQERNFGEAYSTASALLILQLPRRYLPIFQR